MWMAIKGTFIIKVCLVFCISSFSILRKFSWFIFWPWSGCTCINAFSFSCLPHMKLLLFIPVSIILNHLFWASSYKYLFPFMFSSFLLKSECAVLCMAAAQYWSLTLFCPLIATLCRWYQMKLKRHLYCLVIVASILLIIF